MRADELLLRLAVADRSAAVEISEYASGLLTDRSVALVRLGALIAVAAPGASIGSAVDDALSLGISSEEIVGVLACVARDVGAPKVVAAAARISRALGYDDEDG
jgi:alkylhydroperoxidase/carboxymuconolactone decarboxylase family protein YurZ